MVLIQHSEYIGDVITSPSASTFAVNWQVASIYDGLLRINPGNPFLFQVLNQIASSFLHYVFDDLVIEFRSTSATALNSVNTQLGVVMARFEANPTQPVDSNQSLLLNSHGHRASAPTKSWSYKIPCSSTTKLIRFGTALPVNNYGLGTAPTSDIRNYDQGWFMIATNGMQGTSVNCGQIHVHYKCHLIRELGIQSQIGSNLRYYYGNANIGVTGGTNPLGTGAFILQSTSSNPSNFNTMTLTRTTGTTMTMDPSIRGGTFMLQLTWIFTTPNAGVQSQAAVTLTNGATIGTYSSTAATFQDHIGNLNSQASTNGTTAQLTVIFSVTSASPLSPPVITIPTITNSGTGTTCVDIILTQINGQAYGQNNF